MVLTAIILVTFVCFLPSLENGFTNWDDPLYVTENSYIRDLSFDSAMHLFNTSVRYADNYHPLTALSNAIEYGFAGTDPRLYHVDNLVLHLLGVGLVFIFTFFLVFDRERVVTDRERLMTAAIVALSFGIHPMHVESVAWISERKDVLYGAFYLAALIAYLWHLRQNAGVRWLVLCFAFFTLSLLSKAMAVTLPAVLVLIDIYRGRRLTSAVLAEKLPFLAMSVVFGGIASSAGLFNEGYLTPTFQPYERLFLVSYAILRYVAFFVVPFPLAAVHPYPQPVNGHLPAIFYAAPVVLAALGALIYRVRASRDTVFGTLFFVTTISVVLQIVPATQSFLAERYTYLAYIGLLFVAARLFVKGWESAAASHGPASLVTIAGVTALAGLAVGCGGLTYQRSKVWHDSLTLWTDAIAHEPQAATAYHNLAEAKTQAGEEDDVIRLYTLAIAYNPRHYKAYIDRGNAKLRLKDYEGALADYQDALRIQPGEGIAHFDAGVAAYYAGRIREACEDWRTAVVEGYLDAENDVDRYCR